MKYPMCCDWLIFHRKTENTCVVENYLDDSLVVLSASAVSFLRKLNGRRNPYRIDKNMKREDVDRLLDYFRSHDLTRESGFVSKDLFFTMFSVFFFKGRKAARITARRLNTALMVCFLPILAAGIAVYAVRGDTDWNLATLGSYIGLAVGMVLHEAGHAAAALGYGARVFEAGLTFRFLLFGAYVMLDDRPVKGQLRRFQIYAAGVEMNLLIAGVSLLTASLTKWVSGFFMGVAIQNLLLAALNVLFIFGLDGDKMISILLGQKDFIGSAIETMLHGDKRKKLWNKGPGGKAATIASACVLLLQASLPLVLLINAWEVVRWIADLF